MENLVALELLSAGLEAGTVPEKDREFVSSLVKQSSKGLSPKQWYWVGRLATKLTGGDTKTVTSFERVYAMFRHAQQHLKHPKVVLATPSGRELKLYVSGSRSRVPDTVNVVDTTTDVWYGRVYADGRWEVGNGLPDAVAEVEALLKRFAEQPEQVAAEHGRLHGACCFCSRSLKDERSTDVGYGPVCASRYGLTWGKK